MILNLDKITQIELNPFEFKTKCECQTKNYSKRQSKSTGKPFRYPHQNQLNKNNASFKTFKIKYNGKLSLIAQFLLNNFQNKYFYYAIDDVLYLLKSNPIEKNNLLMILYSPIIFLQNNFSINFLEIWIHAIYIENTCIKNKFLKDNSKSFSSITIELFYLLPIPIKKKETIW